MAERGTSSDGRVAIAVRAMRQTHHFSQQAFAIFLGVHLRTLQHWERGDRRPPTLVLRYLRELNDRPAWSERIHQREAVETLLVDVGLLSVGRSPPTAIG
jgi:transcriptional regulator with XRE-family HTH domain